MRAAIRPRGSRNEPTPAGLPLDNSSRPHQRVRVDPARRPVTIFGLLAVAYIAAIHLPPIPSVLAFSIACAACTAACLTRGRACAIALSIAALAFCMGWFAFRIHEAPADRPRPTLPQTPFLAEGIVIAARPVPPPEGLDAFAVLRSRAAARVDVRIRSFNSAPASGLVRLSIPRGIDPRPGDLLRFRGTATPIPPRANPGELDPRPWAAQEGLFATASIPDASLVERLPGRPLESRIRRGLDDLRRRTDSLLARDGSPPRALLRAMLLGEEDAEVSGLRSAFTRLGLAHLVAISGLNLTLMAGVAIFLVRLTGDHGPFESILVGGLILIYMLVLPLNTPVLRAGILALALLGARAAGRRYDPLAILALTATAILLWRPMDLFTLSFQLSFGLVAVLIRAAPAAHERLFAIPVRTDLPRRIPLWRSFVLEPAKRLFSTSLLCWLVATPLILLHTGLFSPAAVLTTMFVAPVLLLVLAAGYILLIVGSIIPAIAEPAGPLVDGLAAAAVFVVRRLDELPGLSVRLPSPSIAWTIVATSLPFWWLKRGHLRDGRSWGLAGAVVLWLLAEAWSAPRPRPGVALRIDTLAVGDGTCHLLRAGGAALIWDCGSTRPGIGERLVPRAVFALGPTGIERLVITHPNLDHFNGVLGAADALGIREVMVSPAFPARALDRPTGPEAALMEGLEARGIRLRVLAMGDEIPLGPLRLEVLSPPVGADWPEPNDHSLIALARAGGASFLLTGDAQADAIRHISAAEPGLRLDAVELPHHGSARPEALEFILRTSPRVIVQSTGPSRVNLAFWDGPRSRSRWHTTASDGAVWVEILGDGTMRSGSLRD